MKNLFCLFIALILISESQGQEVISNEYYDDGNKVIEKNWVDGNQKMTLIEVFSQKDSEFWYFIDENGIEVGLNIYLVKDYGKYFRADVSIVNNSDKKIVILNSHQLFWSEIEGIDISPNSYDLLETELSKTPLEWLEINEDKYLIVISGDYGVPIDQNTSCYSVSNNLFIANGIGDKDNDTIITIKDYDDHLVLKEELLTK